MAMNGNQLGDEIEAAVVALFPEPDFSDERRNELARAIGNAIVNHIVANGVVLPTSPTPLTSPSGPVTGTGTLT